MNRFLPLALVLLLGASGPQDAPTGKPWIDMDYGSTLTASLEVEPGNIAYKGVAIRLDPGPGGVSAGRAFALFDTDTLRWAAGWTGKGFINWRNILFDGSHQTHARIVGDRIFRNPVAPGWGKPKDAAFEDPRLRGRDGKPYGPLPRAWGTWKGLYVNGDTVVLSYTVGDAEILEVPGLEGDAVLTRTLRIGPRSKDLVLQVAHEAGRSASVTAPDRAVFGGASAPKVGGIAFDGSTSLAVAPSREFDFTGRDYTLYAKVKTKRGGSLIAHAPAEGEWQHDGKTFFVRDGRLVFDIGWVGQVQSEKRLSPGKWHDAVMTWKHETGKIAFYIDGEPAGGAERTLKPRKPAKSFVVKIGYTSSNFPERAPTHLHGSLAEARIYGRALTAKQVSSLREPESLEGLLGRWVPEKAVNGSVADLSGKGHTAKLRGASGRAAGGAAGFGLKGAPEGAAWIAAPDGHLRLRIPAGREPLLFKLLHARMEDAALADAVAASAPPVDPATFTRGGPARWTGTVTTKPTTRAGAEDPYAVDTLTVPMKNPYRSWMRLGGFDFFKDGRRAAVCTWMGDVWVVDGLGGGDLTWRRIAAGMFQPLGVKIVDGTITVSCRDQITMLRDLNGDGETDFYESFNHDHQVTEHFHEFAMGLQTDAEGNFYYAKSARHAKDSLVPHHGTLIKVSKDGSKSEIVCNGFRAANGVGFGPEGEVAVSDQQGHWTPANRINIITPGGFYGNMFSYHRGERPTRFAPPTVWLPQKFDRSPAEQVWVPDDRWGPFKGRMLSLSYGTGRLLHVMYEKTEGVYQGAAFKFPWDFPTGIMRGRFHPDDGQFYFCGLFGWAGDKTRPGGFYRIRYTGKPVRMPLAHRVRSDGIDLTFTCALDKAQAEDAENYVVKRWNYRWAARYGSDHYSVENPRRRGEDPVNVSAAKLLGDGRTVRLTIEDFKPVMQMEIRYALRAADGARLRQTVYSTVNALPRR